MTTEVTTYQPRPRNAMMIKNLCPGLMELGKIKIGNKGKSRASSGGGTWQAPQKLDHFLITTMQRGEDNNFLQDDRLHKLMDPTGDRPIRSIPVRLIYDDISLNFATRYICYYGKKVFCSGDGEEAQRVQRDGSFKTVVCTCGRQDPKYNGDNGPGGPDAVGGDNTKGKCKINGILSVIIDGAQAVGGVWKFRTTSYNSVVGILSSLAMIQRITGGRLAGIPLNITVTPKTVQDPLQGTQQTIYVVGLQYAGTIDTLRDVGYQIALTEAKHGISMARIEEDARLMLTHTPTSGLGDDPVSDVIEEFYPEEARPDAPDLVAVESAPAPLAAAAAIEDAGDAPLLASPTIEDAEIVDPSTGEIIEQHPDGPAEQPPVEKKQEEPPAVQTPDKKRRGPGKQVAAEPPPQAAPKETKEDDFPDLPGTRAAQQQEPPHPAAEQQTAGAVQEPDEECGDLF